ncbi:Putative 2-aminoethylphosphonate transport system permease protein PhnV [Variovorax sp. PBS-H4]|uniref:ABC transporter permease n=1 Tax=Variovorax sp. PBS-H4 TaxID=434008 RepID=UPI00131956D7|nr:ABC transporter permease [Variovorax sp. PBS-H4]VTU27856.1 Putative 2-aminoethylphosphonate transport system permease protein PhnV [Variovorax sp. PBS-H4]
MSKNKRKAVGTRVADGLGLAYVGAVYVFLVLPIAVIVMMSLNAGEFLTFPPQGISLRWFGALFANEAFMRAIGTSLKVAAIATVCSTLIGVAGALYVVRHATRLREWLRMMLMLPLMLPEILTAIALLFFLYASGIGTRTMFGLLVGHVLVTLPYVFTNVASSLYNQDASLEQAARSLGASPWRAFVRVTLPLIKPGIITGALFAFVISFDLFNMSLLLKGIGMTTLPLQLFDYLRWDFDPTAAAVSTLSIVLTLIAVVWVDRTVGLRTLRFG